jgi:hypothetical protein
VTLNLPSYVSGSSTVAAESEVYASRINTESTGARRKTMLSELSAVVAVILNFPPVSKCGVRDV